MWTLAWLLAWLLVAFPALARAWGPTGHAVTALVAEARLHPHALARARALLGPASLAEAASWADRIKKRPGEAYRAPYHYASALCDVPRVCAFDEAQDCARGGCVTTATRNYTAQLGHHDTEVARDALLMVLHLLGDLHQPLHWVARARGGNDLPVVLAGRAASLHRVWDSLVLEGRLRRDFAGSAPAYAAVLLARPHPAEAATDPAAWVAADIGLHCSLVWPEAGVGPAELSPAYVAAAERAVDAQLLKGGLRLAAVLNAAYAPAPARLPPEPPGRDAGLAQWV